jgi:hypothetical protein
MKEKKWLMFCVGILILIMIPFKTHGTIKLTDNFFIYGFIKLDAHYQDGGVNHIVASRYAVPGDGNLALTAMNTRFGFKWTGATIGKGWKIGALMEWDLFDTASANQMKLRTRHLNFTLSKNGSQFLFGQFWDVFAPAVPSTINTNGALWQTGNVGFRRAQIRYSYHSGPFDFAVSLNDPTSAEGRAKKLPLLEARLGVNLGEKSKVKIGVSGVYGSETHSSNGYENSVSVMGVCVDWSAAVSRFSLKGEFTIGQNLKNFVSKAYIYDNTAVMEIEGEKISAFWTELYFKATKKINVWAGYAFESLSGNQLINGELDDTNCIYVGIKYIPGGGIFIGLEYTNFHSKYLNADNQTTNQIILSFCYGF